MKRLLNIYFATLFLSMAKVDGPLFSISARGKIADAMVHFPWKGRNVVRQWLKPTNKMSVLQGFVRAALKGISRGLSKIYSTSSGSALDSKLYTLFTAACPSDLNWNAFVVQGLMALLQAGGTFLTSNWTALVAEYSALSTGALTAFKTNGTALGMTDFAFGYGYTTNIEAGLQLYLVAKAAYAKSLAATAPYNTSPTGWAASDVDGFKSDFTTA